MKTAPLTVISTLVVASVASSALACPFMSTASSGAQQSYRIADSSQPDPVKGTTEGAKAVGEGAKEGGEAVGEGIAKGADDVAKGAEKGPVGAAEGVAKGTVEVGKGVAEGVVKTGKGVAKGVGCVVTFGTSC